MTYEEAKMLLEMISSEDLTSKGIEAISIAIKCIDKQIPKKPKKGRLYPNTIYRYLHCAACDCVLHGAYREDLNIHDHSLKERCCGFCGQAIDWSDEE